MGFRVVHSCGAVTNFSPAFTTTMTTITGQTTATDKWRSARHHQVPLPVELVAPGTERLCRLRLSGDHRACSRNKTTSLGDRLELLRFGVWHPAVRIIRFGTIRCSKFILFSFLPPAAPRPMNNEDGGTVFIFLPAAPWQTLKSPLGFSKPSGVLVYAHV
jgi:hypothetical protein